MQTHYHDIIYSWVRSYDSFYSDVKYACKHSYGVWSTVKEASTEDYGVRIKTCERCNDILYEAIPKIETDTSALPASLFGEGSTVVIISSAIAMIAVGAAIHFYVRLQKESAVSPKDDE